MVSTSKNFREQAQQAGEQMVQQILPRLEGVRGQLDDAREQLAPRLAEARDQLGPALEQAREQVGPLLEEARRQVEDARQQAAPYVARAGDRLVNDVAPAVQSALQDARDQAGPLVAEARRRGEAAAAALQGEDVRRSRGGKKKWLALAAVLGAAAVAAKKVMDSGSGTHAAYPPATAPSPVPTHTGPTGVPPQPGATGSDDAAGATPSEALADSTEAPHGVTTPDNPADVVPITPEADR